MVVLFLVVPFAVGRQAMHGVPVYQLDGAFQTASGLFRLADGELPGRDFFPYLGIGPVFLLFPLFLAAGADLTASVFSSYAVTQLVFQTVVGVLAMLFFPRRSGRAFLVGAGIAAVVAALGMFRPEVYTWFDGLIGIAAIPGNSLRPIRAAAPYLLTMVAFLLLRGGWTIRRAAVLGGAAGLVMAVWSNDYGLASGGLILVLTSILVLVRGWTPRWQGLVALWAGAAGGFIGAGFLATAGGFVPLLRYNLVDVRGDQFWYFGPWSPADRIYSIGDLYRSMANEGALPALLVLVVVLVLAVLRPTVERALVLFLGGAVLAGGVAATIGGHTGGYYWSFVLWGWLVGALLVARLAIWGVRRLDRQVAPPRAARRAVAAVAVATLAASGAAAVYEARATGGDLARAGGVYIPELGGLVPPDFLDQVEEVDGVDDVVEEYSGLAGALNGPTEALSVDSVIAALGDERTAFADFMQRPHELVVTASPSIIWTTWGIGANWWFYRELFRAYAPETSSPLTVNWRPATPRAWPGVPCEVDGGAIRLSTPELGMYEVDLRYEGPGRGSRSFTMVENNLSVASSAQGFQALDPGADRQRFPVIVRDTGAGNRTLALKDVSNTTNPVTRLVSCTASRVLFPTESDARAVYGSFFSGPVDLTDANWDRGISRLAAGFFVYYTPMNWEDLSTARSVRFADGQVRRIVDVQQAGDYINVALSGAPLDPATTGAPNQISYLP
ncbi:hypothetical protein [Klenkia taihuensis]|uniref:hypothetical protein n=1 Tax=Klenkia taihuensis TaxID=1225127 RepID=UPI0010424DA8|nr:hypothetical protein [Klenkia taihuensis]